VALQVATLTEVEREHARSRGNILRDAWHGLMTRRVGKLDLQALRQVDAIQVENPWMFELAQGIQSGEGKITRYAPPGTDTSHFTPLQTRDPAKGYILAVGRFQDARKNLPLLLEAYALVCTRSADAPKLVLAGASPPPKAFWEKAATKGLTDRIAYIASPSRDALASLYRNAQSFVLTSHEEGFGIVLTEAMASGIPVVATRCGGPEGIVSDGDDGFLVDEDSVTLADRLLSLCEDLDLNLGMGAAARVTAETRFSDTVTGDAFLETYDYLLRRSQQPRGY
jgi:glycosyltransferase involved in cell wall biosynthesis